jgi:histone acetyltransferase (RNA polymerase elongator complex component)
LKGVVVPFFISHLGCPHRCVFCDQEKIAGAKGGLPTAGEIQAKVAEYRESAPGRGVEVAFYGGTFTALPRRDQEQLLGALQQLLETGVVESLRLSTRPDAVDAETAFFLKRLGVTTVELGVQSMDDEVLTLSGRGHCGADVEAAVGALRGAGITVGIQLMPGLPGDCDQRSLASLDRVLALKPSFLRIYPTLVISGTELAGLFLRGEYAPLELDEAVSLAKRMLLKAKRAAVPVIRMGLQPTAELERPGVLLAGPYHPAFGQLVASELCFDIMSALVSGIPPGSAVTLFAPPGRVSDLVGQKRRNLARLTEMHGITVAAVREEAALAADEIAVEWIEGRRQIGVAGGILCSAE